MEFPEEGRALLLHACWLIETARARALEWRGHDESAKRTAERAEIVRGNAEDAGVHLLTDVAEAHTEWMREVTGLPGETGAIGWFFLQRMGQFTDSHLTDIIPASDLQRLAELLSPDADEVNASIARDGLPPPPPAEWPEAPIAVAPGEVKTRFAIMGDPHLGIRASEKFIPVVVDDINREEVDFTVIIGDLTQSGRQEQFVEAKEAFDLLHAPYVPTVGNHDQWGYMTERPMGLERFRSIFQREPNAIHESNGVRMIVINSADPTASPFPPFDILSGGFTEEPNESVPGGVISEEVAEWMGSIEPAGPTLICLHHPPYPYPGHPPIVFGLDEADETSRRSGRPYRRMGRLLRTHPSLRCLRIRRRSVHRMSLIQGVAVRLWHRRVER